MDVHPSGQDPATGDDELAKVLAGVSSDPTAKPQTSDLTADLQFEETPGPDKKASLTPATGSTPVAAPEPPVTTEDSSPSDAAQPTPVAAPASAVSDPALENIKKSALEELRPLVGKLNLLPEEKFDTILLIIRSTDDRSLLDAAHEAAKAITDETKRAQALLDIIKEVDYFDAQV